MLYFAFIHMICSRSFKHSKTLKALRVKPSDLLLLLGLLESVKTCLNEASWGISGRLPFKSAFMQIVANVEESSLLDLICIWGFNTNEDWTSKWTPALISDLLLRKGLGGHQALGLPGSTRLKSKLCWKPEVCVKDSWSVQVKRAFCDRVLHRTKDNGAGSIKRNGFLLQLL